MKLSVPVLAACLLAAGTAFAQAPQGDAQKGPRARFDCSQAKDPKACQEHLDKMKAAHAKARQACEGKQGAERRDCVRHEMCGQAQDPAKCEARAKEQSAQRERIRAACKDKKGDELRACMREHRTKK
jgi:hypothetical protein